MPKTARKRTLPINKGNTKKKKTTGLDLRRLLNTMEKDPAPAGHSSQALQQRSDLLLQLFQDSGAVDDALESRVQVAVRQANAVVAQRRSTEPDNLVEKLFTKRGTAAPPEQEEGDNEAQDEQMEQDDAVKPARSRTARKSSKTKQTKASAQSIKDLQKQQRAQMEEAVSQMASQMKNQTAEIHQKLANQTGTILEEMQDVAEQNVTELSDVAQSTQEHVKQSWKRTAFTWTVLLTVFGAFVATMMTIQMIPKRTDCVLPIFCTRPNAGRPAVERELNQQDVPQDPVVVEQEESEPVTAESEDEPQYVEETVQEQEEMLEDIQEETETEPQQYQEHVDEATEPANQWQYADVARAAALAEMDVLYQIYETSRDLLFFQDQNGWGAAHEAARNGHVGAVEFLINAGVDVSLRTRDGLRPLDLAIENVGLDHQVIGVLKEAMGMECDVGMDGMCVVNIPSDEEMRQEALRDYQETMTGQEDPQQPEARQEINMEDDPSSHTEMPIDKQREYVYDRKPFSGKDVRRAATRGDVRRMRGFVELNPPFIDQKDANGWTALQLAVRQGNLEVVQVLLEGGADQEILNNLGKNAMDVAVSRWGDDSPMTKILEEYE